MATCLIEVLDYYNLTHKSDFSFSISITMPILKRDHSPPWCLNNLILIIDVIPNRNVSVILRQVIIENMYWVQKCFH